MSIPYRLEARGITKTFPGVKALSDVSLTLGAGEVLAVVGENGAGKSTLMKVLAGVQGPDVGVVQVDGQDLAPGSVSRALAAGVALIHQELNLAENLDVASNVMLGREVQRFGLVDNSATVEAALPALKAVGLDVDPQTPLSGLTIGRQQLVEIAKALSVKARVLIMDEPTSSLSGLEADRLFEVVRSLRDSGVSIIYISHRLSEVIELADRVLVLRDGLNAGELCGPEITHSAMVRLMVGRDVSAFYQHEPCTPGELALEVRGLLRFTVGLVALQLRKAGFRALWRVRNHIAVVARRTRRFARARAGCIEAVARSTTPRGSSRSQGWRRFERVVDRDASRLSRLQVRARSYSWATRRRRIPFRELCSCASSGCP